MIITVCFIIAGLCAGLLQFFLLMKTVAVMLKRKRYWLLLLQPLLPIALFVSAALICAEKLYFAALSYTAALVVAAVINLIHSKKKG